MSELLTLRQLVQCRPELTERWVRSMCSRTNEAERLPHYKPGGRLLFDPVEVDVFLRRNHVGPGTVDTTGGTAQEAEDVVPSRSPTAERDEGSPVAPGEPSR
jgi:hypothetical protein